MPVDIDLLQQPQKMAEEYIKGKKGEACNATKKDTKLFNMGKNEG